MDLSLVDLSPVPEGGTATDAYANTVETVTQAERLGYSRAWVAEHHGMANTLAGTTPEVLLGHLAAHTDSIRLGSGTPPNSSSASSIEGRVPKTPCFIRSYVASATARSRAARSSLSAQTAFTATIPRGSSTPPASGEGWNASR